MSTRRLIPAARALPGYQYYTNKDVLLQMAIGLDGTLAIAEDKVHVLAYMVVNGQVDRKKKYPIPKNYSLRPAFERKIGRPRYKDKTWRGWAWKFPDLPEKLLAQAEHAGYYRVENANYISLGVEGRVRFTVFRSGHLGVKDIEDSEYLKDLELPVDTKATLFFPRRVSLEKVVALRRGPDLLEAFTELLDTERD